MSHDQAELIEELKEQVELLQIDNQQCLDNCGDLTSMRTVLVKIGNRIGTPVLDWGPDDMKVKAYEQMVQDVAGMIVDALGVRMFPLTPQEKMLKAHGQVMDFIFDSLDKGGSHATD